MDEKYGVTGMKNRPDPSAISFSIFFGVILGILAKDWILWISKAFYAVVCGILGKG